MKSKLLSKIFLSFSTLALIVGPLTFNKTDLKTNAVDDYAAVLSSRNQSVHRGETFSVDLELSANTGLTTFFVALKFDHKTFTLRDVVQQKEALSQHNLEYSGSGFDYVDDITGGFNLFWDGPKADKSNGKIATLTFETSMTANLGPSQIVFEIVQKNTTAAYDVPAFVKVFSPTIDVKEGKFIVIWNDYDGRPITNDKLTGHPYNDVFKGYEFASESTLDKERDFPSDLPKDEDEEMRCCGLFSIK